MAEMGRSGLSHQGGYVIEELLSNLAGGKELRVYREMSDNDPTVGAILFAINMLTRQVKWDVEPHPDGEDADVEFLENVLEEMDHSWADFVSEVMSMLIYGWSFFEIVYKRREDGKVGWKKIALRAQESLDKWVIDDKTSEIKAFSQRPPPDYEVITIPMKKGVLFRTASNKNNPQGRSILRNAYRPWYFKKRIEEIEAIGIERELAGIPIARVDSSILASTADAEQIALRNEIESILKNVRADKQAGIIWPNDRDADGNSLYEFDLMSSGGTRAFDTTKIIQRYDQRITMTVLADFILLGHEKVGSFALSSDKTDLFAVAIGAWLEMIKETITKQMIKPLFEMNGKTENIPGIKFGDIERPDLTQIASFMSQMAQMGMPLFPDPTLETWTRKTAGLPEPSEEAAKAFEEAQSAELENIQAKAKDGGGSAFANPTTTTEGTSGPEPGEDPFAGLFEDEGNVQKPQEQAKPPRRNRQGGRAGTASRR